VLFCCNYRWSVQNIPEEHGFEGVRCLQAVGKIPVKVNDLNIDLMSISGHKLYGPKGVGAIYIRRRPRVRLEAQISGGGQVPFL